MHIFDSRYVFFSLVKRGWGRHIYMEYLRSRKWNHFSTLKGHFTMVIKADFTKLSYPIVPHSEDGSLLNTYIHQKEVQILCRHCKKKQCMHCSGKAWLLFDMQTHDVTSHKSNGKRVQRTHPVLTHRVDKSLEELMTYKLVGKDCVFCHCIDCIRHKEGTYSRSIKEFQREFISSETR